MTGPRLREADEGTRIAVLRRQATALDRNYTARSSTLPEADRCSVPRRRRTAPLSEPRFKAESLQCDTRRGSPETLAQGRVNVRHLGRARAAFLIGEDGLRRGLSVTPLLPLAIERHS